MKVIQQQDVDATLGDAAVLHSVQAGLIAMLLIMAFMTLYYRLPGLLASAALVIYTAVVLAIFKIGIPGSGPVTLTLAGIAAFVLSVGMAVDANILIFERTKEELRNGRSLIPAVNAGFDRAWPSIRDSNISTLITTSILYWMGNAFSSIADQGIRADAGDWRHHQPVLGDYRHARLPAPGDRDAAGAAPLALDRRPTGRTTNALLEPSGRWRAQNVLNLVSKRNWFYLLSFLVIIPGVISLTIPPRLKPGIEFTSGTTFSFRYAAAGDAGGREEPAQRQRPSGSAGADARGRTSSSSRRRRSRAPRATPPVGPSLPSEREKIETALSKAHGGFLDSTGKPTQQFLDFSSVSASVSKRSAATRPSR